MLLKFLQENTEKEYYKSKDIADALGISGRTVSGSMRKLVTDGYVDKIGENPIIYAITEKGKNYKLD
jgi:Mn-dependent DtxR family transcriptional regulator